MSKRFNVFGVVLALLLGQRISMPYTGIKSHALVVN